jgi:glycosyltransferase involved in cell wall biosynthesis
LYVPESARTVTTKILIGTPCYNGAVTIQYVSSLLRLQQMFVQKGIEFSLAMLGSESLITRARNFIVSQFLGRPQFTHLLFIDADIGFDPAVVFRYLKAERDIVAGIYPLKGLDLDTVRSLPRDQPVAATLRYATKLMDGEVADPEGFAQAEYAATGFMLISRRVLEKMAAGHPELKYTHGFTADQTATTEDVSNLYALFDTSLDRDRGLYLPEDYTFCNRWRAMGGEIWVDVRSKFTHVGSFAFHGDFAAHQNK